MLLDQFDCAVCYELIKQATMTPCGHNFCRGCIAECLNRKHVCPLCNAEATIAQCHANLQLDNLLKIIVTEKEQASKKYFDKLFQQSNEGVAAPSDAPKKDGDDAPPKKPFSPVEALFQKHMRKSLAEFNSYLSALATKRDQAIARARDTAIDKMGRAKAEAAARGANRQQLDEALSPFERELEEELAAVREQHDRSVSLMLQQFDAHLGAATPSVSRLPVAVTVEIENSGARVELVLQPSDTVTDVRAVVCKLLDQRGDPVLSQNERCLFFLRRPLESADRELLAEGAPLGTLRIEPGSTLIWTGPVRLKSDQPPECFVLKYEKGKKVAVDYFTCKDCNINWVCASCAKFCHKGHKIGPYLKEHVPNWACCYCSKKRLCKIDKKEDL